MALEASSNKYLSTALSSLLLTACGAEAEFGARAAGDIHADRSSVEAGAELELYGRVKLDVGFVTDNRERIEDLDLAVEDPTPEIAPKQECITDILARRDLKNLLKDEWHGINNDDKRSIRFRLPETKANDTLGIYFSGLGGSRTLSFWYRQQGSKMKTFSDHGLDGTADFGLIAGNGDRPNEKTFSTNSILSEPEGSEYQEYWQEQNDRAVDLTLKHFKKFAKSDVCQSLDWSQIGKVK